MFLKFPNCQIEGRGGEEILRWLVGWLVGLSMIFYCDYENGTAVMGGWGSAIAICEQMSKRLEINYDMDTEGLEEGIGDGEGDEDEDDEGRDRDINESVEDKRF